jgi:phospholipid/cholesterol/gamma-HCH transport system substrate-binding protein
MGMKSRKVELLVGIFVALTIAAGLMLALKVANQSMSNSEDTYVLYAKFDNIGGLKVRSAVKVGGVTVGRVDDITLSNSDFTPVVTMSISSTWF